jgi:hypothetical protein
MNAGTPVAFADNRQTAAPKIESAFVAKATGDISQPQGGWKMDSNAITS